MFAVYAFACLGLQESTDNYTPVVICLRMEAKGRVCSESYLAVFIVHMFGPCLLLDSVDYGDGNNVVSRITEDD